MGTGIQRGTGRRKAVKQAGLLSWDGLLFLLAATVALFARFRDSTLLLASYQDDFFYYLKIAQNLSTSGTSTFNGLNLTNGYHPLWMLVLTVLARLFHGTVFFFALQTVSLAAALLTWVYFRKVLRLIATDDLARAAALVLGLLAVLLIRYGMEVTAALPLAAWLLYRLAATGLPATPRQSAALGLLAAALVLARLDAAILVGLLCLVALMTPNATPDALWDAMPRPIMRAAAFLVAAAVPLALYLAIEWHFFHLLAPVSGLAKQMRTSHFPAARVWETLQPLDRQRRVLIVPQAVLLLVALCWRSNTTNAADRLRSRIFHAFIAFPFVHWITLSFVSDWSAWPWYTYSLTLGCTGALGLMLQHRSSMAGRRENGRAGTTLLLRAPFYAYTAVLCIYIVGYAVLGPDSISLVTSSRQVAQFMDAHPGTYLMGDQSGTTAFLSHQPIVQTEGLVMDGAFLQQMRARTPLRTIAERYGARFYVAVGQWDVGPCVVLHEPGNAGPTSPTMDGIVCHAPLAAYSRSGVPIRIFETAWIQVLPANKASR